MTISLDTMLYVFGYLLTGPVLLILMQFIGVMAGGKADDVSTGTLVMWMIFWPVLFTIGAPLLLLGIVLKKL